jgi:hypothetical protein
MVVAIEEGRCTGSFAMPNDAKNDQTLAPVAGRAAGIKPGGSNDDVGSASPGAAADESQAQQKPTG